MNLHNVLAWEIYKPYPYPYEYVTPGSAPTGDHYVFWGFWAAVLIFMLAVMDHSAGDKKHFLTAVSVAVTCLGLVSFGLWMHTSTKLLPVQLNLFGNDIGVTAPAWANVPFEMFVPICIVYSVFNINSPMRWPMTWIGAIVGVFTGNMGTTWVPSIQ